MATPATTLKKVLITGAGTGFGYEVAMRLAEKGFDVVAAVEIYGQVQTLKRQADERGVTLQVEKLDVTNDGDRRKAWTGASRFSSTTPASVKAVPRSTFRETTSATSSRSTSPDRCC